MTRSLCGTQERLKAVKYEQSADSEYVTFTYLTRAAAACVCTDVQSVSGVSWAAMWLICVVICNLSLQTDCRATAKSSC